MTGAFRFATRPLRVVFGAGSRASLPEEIHRLGKRRAVLLGTPGRAGTLAGLGDALGERVVGAFDRAVPHVPAPLVHDALELVRRTDPDCVVAVGGGSAIGLGKLVARETGLPLIAVPTTYSGSEMTAIWGSTDGARKQTGRDARAAPVTVIYDPDLTLSLPPATSAASGMNAVAHAVEALYATDAGPLPVLLAEEALRLLGAALPRLVRQPDDLEARTRALLGAHFAGWTLDLTTMGLHHRLCHVLGGEFGLPHGLTHAVLLPHVVAHLAPAAPEAMERVARALGVAEAASGVGALNRSLGVTETLRDLGLRAADLDRAAALAVEGAEALSSPRPLTLAGVRAILEQAYRQSPAPTIIVEPGRP